MAALLGPWLRDIMHSVVAHISTCSCPVRWFEAFERSYKYLQAFLSFLLFDSQAFSVRFNSQSLLSTFTSLLFVAGQSFYSTLFELRFFKMVLMLLSFRDASASTASRSDCTTPLSPRSFASLQSPTSPSFFAILSPIFGDDDAPQTPTAESPTAFYFLPSIKSPTFKPKSQQSLPTSWMPRSPDCYSAIPRHIRSPIRRLASDGDSFCASPTSSYGAMLSPRSALRRSLCSEDPRSPAKSPLANTMHSGRARAVTVSSPRSTTAECGTPSRIEESEEEVQIRMPSSPLPRSEEAQFTLRESCFQQRDREEQVDLSSFRFEIWD
jgi:hypothetical protein